MKRVETSAITDSVRLPLKKTVLDYLQDMTKEIFKEMIISMIGSAYSTSTVYILEGVVNTSANIFTAGSIFYNGVVYLVDAVTLTAGTPYFSLVDVVDESVAYSDGSFHDTLISHKAQLLITGGTTIGNYSAAVRIYSIKEYTGGVKTKVVNIGAWNMDTTDSVIVEIGVVAAKIRGISVVISNDAGSAVFPLNYTNDATGLCDGSWVSITADTRVSLFRLIAGSFDGAGYTTLANRGYITIQYVD